MRKSGRLILLAGLALAIIHLSGIFPTADILSSSLLAQPNTSDTDRVTLTPTSIIFRLAADEMLINEDVPRSIYSDRTYINRPSMIVNGSVTDDRDAPAFGAGTTYWASSDGSVVEVFDLIWAGSPGLPPYRARIQMYDDVALDPTASLFLVCFEDAYPPTDNDFNDEILALRIVNMDEADVYLYIFYDAKESIIEPKSDPSNEHHYENYPEVSFISIVAVRKNAEGNLILYDGAYGPIRLAVTAPTVPTNHIYNLTDNGLKLDYSLLEIDNSGVKWKGLYRLLPSASELAGYLYGGSPVESGQIMEIGDNGITVLAVKSWNYKETISNLVVNFESINYVPVQIVGANFLSLKLNIDNVNLVREEVEKFTKSPAPGVLGGNIADFKGYPGAFVVEGTGGRRYHDIIGILRDAQIAKATSGAAIFPKSREERGMEKDGPDWIQVAVADIYNLNYYEPFSRVYEIFSQAFRKQTYNLIGPSKEEDATKLGEVDPFRPWRITLNAYSNKMRFDTKSTCVYGVTANRTRHSAALHEALHTYKGMNVAQGGLYAGLPLYDSDGDDLVAGVPNSHNLLGQNKYFYVSWDSGLRGFIMPLDSIFIPTDWFEHILSVSDNPLDNRLAGDTVSSNHSDSVYARRLDDKLFRNANPADDELAKIFLFGQGITRTGDFRIPAIYNEHIPCFPNPPYPADNDITFAKILGVYLYKAADPAIGSPSSLISIASSNFVEFETEANRFSASRGYYDWRNYFIKINGYVNAGGDPASSGEAYYQLITQHGYGLYAVYDLHYRYHPEEYDCAIYEIREDWRYGHV